MHTKRAPSYWYSRIRASKDARIEKFFTLSRYQLMDSILVSMQGVLHLRYEGTV
ncbi:hypothetical protein J6TS1_14960 [Siminovitchia terrae]|uniref:Uncharacterized protein n=1 Tax=Siminovitchia terrae TaxID=1914933 RepID=A0ABQ4KUA5_SIMTE|nr:hypothetical protein J22TS1_25870 [Siminovitchia terrae]GIN95626.1 hypothetical protein J6TS1_14960 [Siminovitchia terrae]